MPSSLEAFLFPCPPTIMNQILSREVFVRDSEDSFPSVITNYISNTPILPERGVEAAQVDSERQRYSMERE